MTALVPQRNGIRNSFAVLWRALASGHFSKLHQVGRSLAFVRQRQVPAMFCTEHNAFSALRDTLSSLLRQVGRAVSTVACVGQAAPNKAHVLNPKGFGSRPFVCMHFLKHDHFWLQTSCFQLTKPMQLMRAVVRGFTQVRAQPLWQTFCFANVAKLTRAWVKQAVDRTHLGAIVHV